MLSFNFILNMVCSGCSGCQNIYRSGSDEFRQAVFFQEGCAAPLRRLSSCEHKYCVSSCWWRHQLRTGSIHGVRSTRGDRPIQAKGPEL